VTASPSKSDRAFLAFAVLFAFALRAGYWLVTRRAIDMADAIHYLRMAQQFAGARGGVFDENLPVLYPALGALIHLLVPDWETALRVASLLASTMIVPVLYILAREIFDRRSARIAALLTASWPWLVDYGSRISPEALYVTLWFAAILALHHAMQRGRWTLLLAALAFFAAHLARPEGTFPLLASPLAAWWLARGVPNASIARPAAYTAIVLGLVAVYALTMRLLIGTATVSYRAPMAHDLADYFQRGLVPLGKTFLRLNFDIFPVMLGPALTILLGVGIFVRLDKPGPNRLGSALLFFALLQWAVTLANFSPAPRYIMPLVVTLALWSCHGLGAAVDRLRATGQPRWTRALPALLVFGSMALGLLADLAAEHLATMPRTPREYRAAGQWMRDHLEPGVILSRKPQIGFYADMPVVGLDAETAPDGLLEIARDLGARYFALDERYSAGLLPALAPLLDPGLAPPGLAVVHTNASYDGARVVVYEFAGPDVVYADPESFEPATSHRGPDDRRRTVDLEP
jgi:4-amino-4-deoxy-L-arabinose transferase-like glycosyltransferase